MTEIPSTKSAWVQLYEARRAVGPVKTRAAGRPPSPIPRRKVGMTLSQGELTELEIWQQRFTALLNRKVSIGETVGILTRLCSTRFTLHSHTTPKSLEDLVELIIGDK